MNTTTMSRYDVEKQDQPRYFGFEEDFVEDNIRCIPMIVRFKLDACGIKLKLSQWSKFSASERKRLGDQPCVEPAQINAYRQYLQQLIAVRTGHEATLLAIEENPAWADDDRILPDLQQQAQLIGSEISIGQWRNLYLLQRFALLKLCRPGHENRNFPIAMKEFGLITNQS
jgi:hypothetical protein